MKLQDIDLKFYYYDDKTKQEITIEGRVGQDGWQQWGADKEKLGENVDLIERINNEIAENIEPVEY